MDEQIKRAPTGTPKTIGADIQQTASNNAKIVKITNFQLFAGVLSYDIAIKDKDSRFADGYQNRRMTFDDISKLLTTFKHTPETVAEYQEWCERINDPDVSKKEEERCKSHKMRAKDQGGIVKGILRYGVRSDDNLESISLLMYDIEGGARGELEETVSKMEGYNFGFIVYTTHGHTPDRPRYRLTLFMSRPVSVNEFKVILPKVGKLLDIPHLDPCSKTASQTMFLPSAPLDGVTFSKVVDGHVIDTDAVLAMEQAEQERNDRAGAAEEQAKSEEEKKRAQVLHDIKLLVKRIDEAEVDIATDREVWRDIAYGLARDLEEEGRQYFHRISKHYVKGYNEAETEKMYNSALKGRNRPDGNHIGAIFAAAKTAGIDIRTGMLHHPSGNTGTDFAPKVIDGVIDNPLGLSTEQVIAASMSIEQLGELLSLSVSASKSGPKVEKTTDNLFKIVERAPDLEGRFKYNEFTRRIEIHDGIPGAPLPDGQSRVNIEDHHLSLVKRHISAIYHLEFSTDAINEAIESSARANSYHPVRDYLDGLEGTWDGTPRAEELFIRYLGAEDNRATRTVTRKMLCAAVMRVKHPGCKFDNVVTLIGDEKLGKSTLFKKLCPSDDWFTDNAPRLDDDETKKMVEQTSGKWIVEIPELKSYTNASIEASKCVISRTVDTCRAAYGRNACDYPRQFIFVATTNETNILRGSTGNRRFWPIDVKETSEGKDAMLARINGDIPKVRDQIWAETIGIVKGGEELYLTEELEDIMRNRQAAHNVVWDDLLIEDLRWLGAQKIPVSLKNKPIETLKQYFDYLKKGARFDGVKVDEECVQMPRLSYRHIRILFGAKCTHAENKQIKDAVKALGCKATTTRGWAEPRPFQGFQLPTGDEERDVK